MIFYAVQEAPNRWVTRVNEQWFMATTYEKLHKKVAKYLKDNPQKEDV